MFGIDVHLQLRHGFHGSTESSQYRQARGESKVSDSSTRSGPVADLDALMEGFNTFLTSMDGGNKKPETALQIGREVRRILNDILAGEPYHPKLISRLLTIGQVPHGLLEQYRLGKKGDGKPMKFSTLSVYVSSLQHFFHFLKREPQYLRGSVTPATMEKLGIVLQGCLTSIHKKRTEDDSKKRIHLMELD